MAFPQAAVGVRAVTGGQVSRKGTSTVISDLNGKVALITGAGGRRGIGRATALRLAALGADVALVDIAWPKASRPADEQDDWDGVHSVAAEVEALGRKGLALIADVTDEQQVQNAVVATLQLFGKIDLLVANAAARPGPDRVNVVDLPETALRHVLSVNVVGSFLCCKAVGKHMVGRKSGGNVVIVSSESGRVAKARLAAYCASKFALIGLMQAFALEMAEHGVRVNAVCPGVVDNARLDWTARTVAESSSADSARAQIISDASRATPLGRAATSEEVASVIAFLCSNASFHMTGQALGIDGGSRM